jgi:dimethylargininase
MSVFHFDHALVRRPAASVVRGLRAVDRGAPTFEGIEREFEAYVAALREAGVAVEVLAPLEDFPDAIFVEDPALVFPEGAIVLRPGAPTRRGEAAAIAPELRSRFARVLELADGSVDGGDVMTTPPAVFIGLSARTDEAGARALQRLLAELGRPSRVVTTPADVLHFKSDSSLVDDHTILATPRLAQSGVFDGFRVIHTPAGEEAAANALRINDRILIGDRFKQTIARLEAEGYRVVPLPIDQIALLDAGFSCLSLRWRDPGGSGGGV